MWEHFFRHIDIPRTQIFIPDGAAEDLESECTRYEAVLDAHPVDLQILGLGTNGHIGFNEPDLSLKAPTHVIRLTKGTIDANAHFFGTAGQVPTSAITMGIESILRAHAIILMAFGPGHCATSAFQ